MMYCFVLCMMYFHEQAAINQARALGGTLFCAAGNAADDSTAYAPCNCMGVICVGASTRTGALASYSNRGPNIAFSAPGGELWQV